MERISTSTMHQNQSYLHPQFFWTNQHANPPLPSYPNMFPPQPPFPNLRKKRSNDGTCTCLLIIFLLVLLALTGVGLGTYKIIELQRELDQIKKISGDTENNPSFEKLAGLDIEKKEGRLAAHVTGKKGISVPLEWEDTFGRAFTAGIQYKNRGLIVNQTGLHYLYSSVYFRGTSCKNRKLSHVVYKKSIRYPSEMNLMENAEYHYCANSGMWGRHSYIGAVFNLSSYDILYVNVSDVSLVNFDESKTFFGIYKL